MPETRGQCSAVSGSRLEQLSKEHNARIKSVWQSAAAQQPDDPNIVVISGSTWRVRGTSEVPSFPLRLPSAQGSPEMQISKGQISLFLTGIEQRLVRAAIHAAETSTRRPYNFIKKVNWGCYHDYITVVVVYIDQDVVGNGANLSIPESTIRAFTNIDAIDSIIDG
ncbi:putative protein phosphatase 2C 43 [Nymphaea thermarum]|nr:putative protein phosphatase 2C 43 [Nymphaea thermarum]